MPEDRPKFHPKVEKRYILELGITPNGDRSRYLSSRYSAPYLGELSVAGGKSCKLCRNYHNGLYHLERSMRKSFRKVPTKAPGDFLMPLETLNPIQRQDVVKQLSPPGEPNE